jgi:hypothetical protein
LWSNWVLKNKNNHTAEESVAFAPTLFILSIYFLLIEMVLLLSHTKSYLSSFWSYIKLVPSTLLLINLSAAQNPANIDDVNFWYRQAFAGFFIWLRALYFLRCSEAFGYLIRIVVQVLLKISVFMVILVMVVVGFADTFYALSTSTKYMEGDEFSPYLTSYWNSIQYSYKLSLGEMPDELNDFDGWS